MDRWLDSLKALDWHALAVVWGMRLLGAIAVLLIGLWVIRMIANMAQRALDRAGVDAMLSGFLRNIAYAVLTVVILVMALGTLGVQTTSLLAVLGAAGLAIGLALQGSLSNIASGIMLISLRPFRAGDYVAVAGQEGSVEQVKVFQTVLRTADNRVVTLPNSQITNAPIVNFSSRSERRADIPVGINYECDLADVRQTLLDIAQTHPKVKPTPAPDVLIDSLGESSVRLVLQAWVATSEYGSARSELVQAIHRRLGRSGLYVPLPPRDIQLNLPDAVLDAMTRLPPAQGPAAPA